MFRGIALRGALCLCSILHAAHATAVKNDAEARDERARASAERVRRAWRVVPPVRREWCPWERRFKALPLVQQPAVNHVCANDDPAASFVQFGYSTALPLPYGAHAAGSR